MFPQVEYTMVTAMHEERLRAAATARLIRAAERARPHAAARLRIWAGRGLVALGRRMQVPAPVLAQPADCRQGQGIG